MTLHKTALSALAALAAVVLLGATGCSDAPDGPGRDAAAPSAATDDGSAPTTTAVQADVHLVCTAGQLAVTENRVRGAAPGTYQLWFRNTSTTDCLVRGFPTVLARTEAGTLLGSPASHDLRAGRPYAVVLRAGGAREAALLSVTQAQPGCALVQSASVSVGLGSMEPALVRRSDGVGVCYPGDPRLAVTRIGTTS